MQKIFDSNGKISEEMLEVFRKFEDDVKRFKLCENRLYKEKYGRVRNSIEELKAYLNRISKVDEKTQMLPIFTNNEYVELKNKYMALKTSINAFEDVMNTRNSDEVNKITYALSGLSNMINRDLYDLSNISIDNNSNIIELLNRSKKYFIKVKGDIKVVGGNSNCRYPIQYEDENGKKVEGFFTAQNVYDVNANKCPDSLYNLGIENGTSISNRNIALTRIADLLGCNCVARSRKMQLKHNKKRYKGIFMEKAEGLDFSKISDIKKLKSPVSENNFTNNCLKEMADMSVVDYICQNYDRHSGNIIYNVNMNSEGMVITGVTGIDNDCSFGTTTSRLYNTLPRVCSRSMAEKIGHLSGKSIRQAIQNLGLKDSEINAAVNRFNDLKKKIGDEIIICPDDEFLNRKKRLFQKEGIFSRVKDGINSSYMQYHENEFLYKMKGDNSNEVGISYADSNANLGLWRESEYHAKAFDDLKNDLENAKHIFGTQRTEYFDNMMICLKRARNAAIKYKRGLIAKKTYINNLLELKKYTGTYIAYKTNNMNGSVAKKRMILATNLYKFTKEALAIKNIKQSERLNNNKDRLYINTSKLENNNIGAEMMGKNANDVEMKEKNTNGAGMTEKDIFLL